MLSGPHDPHSTEKKYFHRIEAVEASGDPDHGVDGALQIERQRSPRSHTRTFLAAVKELGLPITEPNTGMPDGFAQTRVNQRRGRRFSSVDRYLEPARGRKNLEILTTAQATRVLFEDDSAGTPRAVGVEYLANGVRHTVRAGREVILAGGTINTPQLLMLSGIGNAAALRGHGVNVLIDLPEVGANLRDHLVSGLIVEVPGDTLYAARKPRQLADYPLRRRGMLTSNVAEAYRFVRSRDDLELPDLELLFAPVAFVEMGLTPAPRHGITLGVLLEQPESSGTITLASPDPFDKPLIDPRYLSDPDGADRKAMLSGLALCDRILHSQAFSPFVGDYIAPAGGGQLRGEERYVTALEQYAHTMYHPVGTCRMGLTLSPWSTRNCGCAG